jgi:CBS domain
MKIRDVAHGPAITVTRGTSSKDVVRTMDDAGVHHLPVLDEGRLVGLWSRTGSGSVVLLGREAISEVTPDADAVTAVEALLGGKDVVVSVGDAGPAGVITGSDLVAMARAGVTTAPGQPLREPLVVRLTGSAGSGKTTLMLNTLPLMADDRVGIVQANPRDEESPAPILDNVPIVESEHAHWRKGFQECIKGLGGVQVVMCEDRDGPLESARGLGEDLLVAVVTPDEVATVAVRELEEIQGLVITHLDTASAGFDLAAVRERLTAVNGALEVFAVSASPDDPGLRAWCDWLDTRARPHRP